MRDSELYDFEVVNWSAQALKRKYGLTPADVAKMKVEQGFACAACNKPFTHTPQVDHSHKTGKVRGLLCGKCNSALGFAGDSIKRLRGLIKYLKTHK